MASAVVCLPRWRSAQHDDRIKNSRRGKWDWPRFGCNGGAQRHHAGRKGREFVATAYDLDHQFGLLIDTLAITGTRPSQAVRLRVEDLHDHPSAEIEMPKSAKGGGRNRAQKKHERYSVPITLQLAANLKAAAKGRAGDAPLLLQRDGLAWGQHPARIAIVRSTASSRPLV